MDARDGTPKHILGMAIRSHTRIYVSYLIPSCLELMVYIVQMIADCAVSFQYFRTGQPQYGWFTLVLVLAPPVLCFIIVITSAEQWSNPLYANKKQFIAYHLLNLLLFPIVVVYRLARRIFWSIEALFHDNNDTERMNCLAKSGECSTCELYLLIQAYAQSAPQIILLLNNMLSQDLFRNYNTTTVQAISLVFSAIQLASITVTYQRFESQKLGGRPYPWAVPNQIESQKQQLLAADRLRNETEEKRRESERTISQFPQSNTIMENFKLRHSDPDSRRHKDDSSEPLDIVVHVHGEDETDNGTESDLTQALNPKHSNSSSPPLKNFTDDEKIKSNNPMQVKTRLSQSSINAIEHCDMVPETPAPPLPGAGEVFPVPELRTQASNTSATTAGAVGKTNRFSTTANRISNYKDMLWLNAQLYIKENVPRPPKMLTGRLEENPPNDGRDVSPSPSSSPPKPSPKDETDFFIPRPRKIVNGIEEDDFAAKAVAFLGWLAFICMRMVALSTFCIFYNRAFFILLATHYVLMLFWLALESKFKEKLNRILFYLLLAYIYIFVILEFRIKFKHIRVWYVGFFVVAMTENLAMTFIWWLHAEFESWWYGYLFEVVMYCGGIFSITLVVYYSILKPKNVVYLLEDNK